MTTLRKDPTSKPNSAHAAINRAVTYARYPNLSLMTGRLWTSRWT